MHIQKSINICSILLFKVVLVGCSHIRSNMGMQSIKGEQDVIAARPKEGRQGAITTQPIKASQSGIPNQPTDPDGASCSHDGINKACNYIACGSIIGPLGYGLAKTCFG